MNQDRFAKQMAEKRRENAAKSYVEAKKKGQAGDEQRFYETKYPDLSEKYRRIYGRQA